MRILLTGGRGFIGRHLASELISRGHEVVIVDREDGDLSIDGVAISLFIQQSPDMVVHLAARPGRVFGEEEPSLTVGDNVTATIYVAQACTAVGARLCYISTSEVYGDICSLGEPPINERDAGRDIRNLYALTKWMGEKASELYAPDDLLIIRPSMTYGPSMATGRGRAALPTMIDCFLHNQTYTVHRDCYRSWCYTDDLVRGMADVIERGEGTYNVGRDDDLRSMEDLAHIVCDVLQTDPDLILIGEHDSTITPIKDISMNRLRSLGWKPNVSLVEGIHNTADVILQARR